jgi:hypothetical protein
VTAPVVVSEQLRTIFKSKCEKHTSPDGLQKL